MKDDFTRYLRLQEIRSIIREVVRISERTTDLDLELSEQRRQLFQKTKRLHDLIKQENEYDNSRQTTGK